MEERIADFAIRLAEGDLNGVLEWLRSLGCKDIYQEKESATVTGLSGVRVGMLSADPVTCAVQLGFALAGQFWPHVYPDLLPMVNRLWRENKERIKVKRREYQERSTRETARAASVAKGFGLDLVGPV